MIKTFKTLLLKHYNKIWKLLKHYNKIWKTFKTLQ